MNTWRTEHCAEQPAELQLIGKDLYIQRRNIHMVEHEATEGTEAYTDWECESREVTLIEYKQLLTDDAVEQNTADIFYIAMMADIDLDEEE